MANYDLFSRAGVSYKHQAALTTTPQVFPLTKDAANAPTSAVVPTFAEFKQLNVQVDTIAAGASSVQYYIAADAAGDIPLTPQGTMSILTGKTTATKGSAIDCIDIDYHFQQLAVETVGTVYVIIWLNAGTANGDIRLHWHA
jgi:hypothetical protein